MSNKEGGRKKLLSAEARGILSEFEGKTIGETDMARDAQGRPFFPDREVDFNISHSGNLAAVSLVKGAALRTGCDIELIRPRKGARKIAEDFFSIAEKNYLYEQGRFIESRFYEIWTLKECYLKLNGFSVFDMPSCPSFVNDEGHFSFGAAVSCPLSFRLYELSDGGDERYILAAAIEGAEQSPPEIRWFSQLSFTCKMTAEIKAAPNPAETVMPKI